MHEGHWIRTGFYITCTTDRRLFVYRSMYYIHIHYIHTSHLFPLNSTGKYMLKIKSCVQGSGVVGQWVTLPSQLHGLQFKPEFDSLSVQSSACSHHVCRGFLWVLLFPLFSQNMLLCGLSTLNFPWV